MSNEDNNQQNHYQNIQENIELNEYIKEYLKFNEFDNSYDCFAAEINARRMSSKLQQKALFKNPSEVENAPKLYNMLKDEDYRK